MALYRVAKLFGTLVASRVAAKAVISAEVERLHWRLWNGKAANARISIDRIHAVMHHFTGEPGTRKPIAGIVNLTISGTSWRNFRSLSGPSAVLLGTIC